MKKQFAFLFALFNTIAVCAQWTPEEGIQVRTAVMCYVRSPLNDAGTDIITAQSSLPELKDYLKSCFDKRTITSIHNVKKALALSSNWQAFTYFLQNETEVLEKELLPLVNSDLLPAYNKKNPTAPKQPLTFENLLNVSTDTALYELFQESMKRRIDRYIKLQQIHEMYKGRYSTK